MDMWGDVHTGIPSLCHFFPQGLCFSQHPSTDSMLPAVVWIFSGISALIRVQDPLQEDKDVLEGGRTVVWVLPFMSKLHEEQGWKQGTSCVSYRIWSHPDVVPPPELDAHTSPVSHTPHPVPCAKVLLAQRVWQKPAQHPASPTAELLPRWGQLQTSLVTNLDPNSQRLLTSPFRLLSLIHRFWAQIF